MGDTYRIGDLFPDIKFSLIYFLNTPVYNFFQIDREYTYRMEH